MALALSQSEKLAFEHIILTIFLKTPSKITQYIYDKTWARGHLKAPSSDNPYSITLYVRNGKLNCYFTNDVDEYDKEFIKNVILDDEIATANFKIEPSEFGR